MTEVARCRCIKWRDGELCCLMRPKEPMTSVSVTNPGWIAVDLDGTLAHYDRWRGEEHIGEPVPVMLARVKAWLAEGRRVKIFTARAGSDVACNAIANWCAEHGLPQLDITNVKDFAMIELWDDRCVQVEKNTGRAIRGE